MSQKAISLQEKGSGGKHVKKEKKLTNIGIEDLLHFLIVFCNLRSLEIMALCIRVSGHGLRMHSH
jgi:hypothetical protein